MKPHISTHLVFSGRALKARHLRLLETSLFLTLFNVTDNQHVSKPRSHPIWYRDRNGLMFSIVAVTFLSFIITAPIVLVLTGLDSLNYVLPQPSQTTCAIFTVSHLLSRIIIFTCILAEMSTTVGLAHMTFIMFFLSSRACLSHIKSYRQANWRFFVKHNLRR